MPKDALAPINPWLYHEADLLVEQQRTLRIRFSIHSGPKTHPCSVSKLPMHSMSPLSLRARATDARSPRVHVGPSSALIKSRHMSG
jgi:hypothetical protein